ncbi:MAG: response regulator [Myxococcota bacterium]
MRSKVLIVDDDPMSIKILETALKGRGYDVMTRTEAIGTSTVILRERPHVVVMDVDMPALNGDRIVSMIRTKVPGTTFVLCSGLPKDELTRVANDCGATAVSKGDLREIVRVVESALV